MKHTQLIMSCTAALLLSGCLSQLPSLSPWYSEKDMAFDEGLTGTWREPDPDTGEWTFKQRDPAQKVHELTVRNQWQVGKFDAVLFRLGGEMLLDFAPRSETLADTSVNSIYQEALVPGHLLCKVVRTDRTLVIKFLDGGAVAELLKKKPGALPHHRIGDRVVTITASTEQLREFVRTHIKDEGLWGGTMMLKRTGLKPMVRWK